MKPRQDAAPPPAITFLTQDEVRRLLAVIPGKRDRALFQLAYHHGLRASEVSLLHRDDIHAKPGRIYIPRVKGSLAKPIPYNRRTSGSSGRICGPARMTRRISLSPPAVSPWNAGRIGI